MKAPGRVFLLISGIVYIIWGSQYALSFFAMLFEGEIDLAVILGIITGCLLFVGIMSVKFYRQTGKAAKRLCVMGISMMLLNGAGILWILIDERIRMEAALGAFVLLIQFSILFIFSILLFIGATLNRLAYRREKQSGNETV